METPLSPMSSKTLDSSAAYLTPQSELDSSCHNTNNNTNNIEIDIGIDNLNESPSPSSSSSSPCKSFNRSLLESAKSHSHSHSHSHSNTHSHSPVSGSIAVSVSSATSAVAMSCHSHDNEHDNSHEHEHHNEHQPLVTSFEISPKPPLDTIITTADSNLRQQQNNNNNINIDSNNSDNSIISPLPIPTHPHSNTNTNTNPHPQPQPHQPFIGTLTLNNTTSYSSSIRNLIHQHAIKEHIHINTALILIKPFANTELTRKFVRKRIFDCFYGNDDDGDGDNDGDDNGDGNDHNYNDLSFDSLDHAHDTTQIHIHGCIHTHTHEHTNTHTHEYAHEHIHENGHKHPIETHDGRLISEYEINNLQIQNHNLIDLQYKTIALYATGMRACHSIPKMILQSSNSNSSLSNSTSNSSSSSSSNSSSNSSPLKHKFDTIFGEDLHIVLKENRILNAVEACSTCACTPELLYDLWKEAENFTINTTTTNTNTTTNSNTNTNSGIGKNGKSSLQKVVKFANGYYIANLLLHDHNVYVINGFYMAMKEQYVQSRSGSGSRSGNSNSNSVHAFVVQWDESLLSYHDFRHDVVGVDSGSGCGSNVDIGTGSKCANNDNNDNEKLYNGNGNDNDNEKEVEKSISQYIHDNYIELGIESLPYTSKYTSSSSTTSNTSTISQQQQSSIQKEMAILNNAIHVSASPLEALAEQCIWLQSEVKRIEYGKLLLSRGIPESIILDWCYDLNVQVPNKVGMSSVSGNDDNDDNNYSKDKKSKKGKGRKKKKNKQKHKKGQESFCYQSPFELVKDLNTKECTDKMIGIYDYELFGSNMEQQSKCSKCWRF